MVTPKGKLIAIGGAEDKGSELERGMLTLSNLNFIELGILRRIVKEAGGPGARIEVVTTASVIPFEVGDNYLQAFGRIGCTNIGVMHIRDRKDALNAEYLKRVEECDAIMFSGGNQLRLTATFGGTAFLQIIQQRYQTENFLIAGTSAGAMAMSNTMIYHGDASHAHLKGEVKLITGLGFMPDVIIDSHFEKRGRFGRLSQAVGANP
ncbi:MAG: cyanophycinase, partial [Segetibacter sp.]|nr:cyanophycinase [Segetibacter sp.]